MHLYDFARPEMEPFVPATARTVLDVGCSTGKFGEPLVARGCEVVGIEPDESAAELARQRLSRVIVGTFPESAAAVARPGGYDAVVYNDVLEHMTHPERALAATRDLLAPDGVLVASIPNVRHVTALGPLLVRGDWTYTDVGVLDRTHLRFFTRRSIVALFTDAGWTIEQLVGINRCRHPAVGDTRALRTLSRLSGGRTDAFFYLQYAVVARP